MKLSSDWPMDDLTSDKKLLLKADGHLLALGGPGSGKTYISLLKAHHIIRSGGIKTGQHILFLSFARATIARVAQQAGLILPKADRSALEINTYHGFAWRLLQSHGYLVNKTKTVRLLPPPEAASRLAETSMGTREAEKERLFNDEGLLHFDLFAAVSAELLTKSKALRRIICDAYPIIILDEFQDTNFDEWQMIKVLGSESTLIALADADQRIYEFRGADPRRIGEFITSYNPRQFDFGSENNRSNGTDIAIFGNDLLTGAHKSKKYNDVAIIRYGFYKGRNIHFPVKTALLSGIKRMCRNESCGWSIAVLVPTKKLMITVSDYLSTEADGLPSIQHDVAMDTEGPSLAAVIIAGLLEGRPSMEETARKIILDLCTHIRGRKGNDPPNQGELDLTGALGGYILSGAIRGKKRQQIIDEAFRIAQERHNLILTGDPWEDWLAVRRLLADSSAETLRQVAEDAKYLRLLHKGAILRSRLSELWRSNGAYVGAASAIQNALVQEHFSAATKDWKGIHVMTMHKSKGKEFNEVFIYEGRYQGRIVRAKSSENDIAQSRLALRVAVTRAKSRTTILTPADDQCPILN